MEAVKIITPPAERKPCVCGATLYICRESTEQRRNQMWRCARHCGARGLTYEGALRRKLRLDLLGWGDLKRKAQALIEADHEDLKCRSCNESSLSTKGVPANTVHRARGSKATTTPAIDEAW